MKDDCGCTEKQSPGTVRTPRLDPPNASDSDGGNAMSDEKPTLIPPADSSAIIATSGDAAPTLTPDTLTAAAAGAITTWNSNKRVSALWGISQNRNSWVYIGGVGWKKLANNSDSAIVALTILAAHAKQAQTNYSYRDESDGMIHETYVW
jgi:hypothetical protein